MADGLDGADRRAAGALADLFFAPATLTPEEQERANALRKKYRGWRDGKGSSVTDVLDLAHETQASEQRRTTARIKRVKTVGARMDSAQVRPAR